MKTNNHVQKKIHTFLKMECMYYRNLNILQNRKFNHLS